MDAPGERLIGGGKGWVTNEKKGERGGGREKGYARDHVKSYRMHASAAPLFNTSVLPPLMPLRVCVNFRSLPRPLFETRIEREARGRESFARNKVLQERTSSTKDFNSTPSTRILQFLRRNRVSPILQRRPNVCLN